VVVVVVLLRGGGGVGRAFAILLFLFCFKLEETGEHGGVYTSVVSVSCSQSDDAMMTTKSLVCFFKVQLTNTVTYLSFQCLTAYSTSNIVCLFI